MTDSEINLAIAKIEYPDAAYIDINSEESEEVEVCYKYTINNKVLDYTSHFDYVNEWCDIGPIIEREGISVFKRTSKLWYAYSEVIEDAAGDYWYKNLQKAETPTKAAALCYLKMKGGE